MKPDMELALAARAENIAIVRHALGGLGEVYGISEEKLSDIRLAVTEACSNVVVHAYPERKDRQARGNSRAGWGMMEIAATAVGDDLAVVVRDWGEGIRPRPDSPGLGLGLSLMAALADTVQLGHDMTEHTEVRMTFALSEREIDAGEDPDVATAAVTTIRSGALGSVSDGQA